MVGDKRWRGRAGEPGVERNGTKRNDDPETRPWRCCRVARTNEHANQVGRHIRWQAVADRDDQVTPAPPAGHRFVLTFVRDWLGVHKRTLNWRHWIRKLGVFSFNAQNLPSMESHRSLLTSGDEL